MLREIPNVRQVPGEPTRRWFTGRDLELIIWTSPDKAIVGFQLCYEAAGTAKAITWHADQGFFHSQVDWGEDQWGRKQTPILTPDSTFDKQHVLRLFADCSPSLPHEIAEVLKEKLNSGLVD